MRIHEPGAAEAPRALWVLDDDVATGRWATHRPRVLAFLDELCRAYRERAHGVAMTAPRVDCWRTFVVVSWPTVMVTLHTRCWDLTGKGWAMLDAPAPRDLMAEGGLPVWWVQQRWPSEALRGWREVKCDADA